MEPHDTEKPPLEPDVGDVGVAEKNANRVSTEEHHLKQSLDRYISFLPSIAFDATLQSSWEAMSVSFQAALLNGGPVALVWGTLLAVFGSTAIAASLGEMASINPTVGAQYRWTAIYAPRNVLTPAFWSLLQGYITVIGWMAVCAQVCFLEGTVVQGLIIFNYPNYVPHRWHGTLLAWAVLALPLFCNVFARRLLVPIEAVGGVIHILLLIVFIAVLAAMSPKSSASFVFTQSVSGVSGWNNYGVEWCIGLLPPVFSLAAFDGVIHMSAEVKNAPRRVPQSMVTSVVTNGVMALAFVILILFTIGDLNNALSTPTLYPIIEILYQATGSKRSTTAMMAFIIYIGVVAVFGTLASVSRLTWAFARDNGLPFSSFFSRVHPGLRIPLNALALVSTITMLLQLINIGSTTAFFAILSLNSLALYMSYALPILFIILTKLRGDHIPYGPFRLGRFGIFVNVFALCYAIFICIWLPFPSYQPVNSVDMNYGGPILGAVIIFALTDWCISGRKRFKVPVDIHTMAVEDREESTT